MGKIILDLLIGTVIKMGVPYLISLIPMLPETWRNIAKAIVDAAKEGKVEIRQVKEKVRRKQKEAFSMVGKASTTKGLG